MTHSGVAQYRTNTTGIVIRQAMAADSADLTRSPDIIVTGPKESFDIESFTYPGSMAWYFAAQPKIGAPNYVYVRGVNYTPTGTQNSRVYLYWARSDQLLDPTKWSDSGFTVNGVSQNSVAINAISQWQSVLAQYPALWTPPQPPTDDLTYLLISWVDNSAAPQPPTFPTTPFADTAELNVYIQNNPQMAVLDTIFRGAFLRQLPGQVVTGASEGKKESPDLIITGPDAVQDASSYAQQGSYSPGTPSPNTALGTRNFVYLRAINTRANAGTSRVYLYWTTTGALSPTSWQATGFTFAGHSCNWVDLTADSANQVMVTTVPLVWDVPSGSDPLVLIAYVDTSSTPSPPDFSPFGYLNPHAITDFVSQHPELTWLETKGTQAPAFTEHQEVAMSTSSAMRQYVGIQFHNIPTDGSVNLSVPGPDAKNTIVIKALQVPDPNALLAWPVAYPANFATCAELTYFQGTTAPTAPFRCDVKVIPDANE